MLYRTSKLLGIHMSFPSRICLCLVGLLIVLPFMAGSAHGQASNESTNNLLLRQHHLHPVGFQPSGVAQTTGAPPSSTAVDAVTDSNSGDISGLIAPWASLPPGITVDSSYDIIRSFVAPDGKTVFVVVLSPRGGGTFNAPAMGSNNSPSTPDYYFPWVINRAVAAGDHKILIPKAIYNFNNQTAINSCNANNGCWIIGANSPTCPGGQFPCFPFQNPLSDLDIDFQGSTLNFSVPTNGIVIQYADRVRLKNFTIDYPSLQMSALGTIIADPNGSAHNAVAIDPAYPVDANNPNFQIQAVNTWDQGPDASNVGHFTVDAGLNEPQSEVYFTFDFTNQNGKQVPTVPPTYMGSQTVKTANGTVTYPQVYSCSPMKYKNPPKDAQDCGFGSGIHSSVCSTFYNGCANFDQIPVGARVVVRYLTFSGVSLMAVSSNDIDIENLTLLTNLGSAFQTPFSGGYRGFRVANSRIARSGNRPVSGTGDVFHIGALQGDVIIENNDVSYQGDDGANIFSSTMNINRLVSLNRDEKEAIISIPNSCSDPNLADGPMVGDWLAFYNPNMNRLDIAEVKSIDQLCTNPTVTLYNCASGDCAISLAALNKTYQFADLSQLSTARVYVSNNNFYYNRGHGVLSTAQYGFIGNNHFMFNTLGNVALDGDNVGDGFGSTNMTISNNTMQWPGTQPAFQAVTTNTNGNIDTADVYNKIVIANNIISNTFGAAIGMTSSNNVFLRDNKIDNTNLYPTAAYWAGLPSTDSVVLRGIQQGVMCGTSFSGESTGPVSIAPASASFKDEARCASPEVN